MKLSPSQKSLVYKIKVKGGVKLILYKLKVKSRFKVKVVVKVRIRIRREVNKILFRKCRLLKVRRTLDLTTMIQSSRLPCWWTAGHR